MIEKSVKHRANDASNDVIAHPYEGSPPKKNWPELGLCPHRRTPPQAVGWDKKSEKNQCLFCLGPIKMQIEINPIQIQTRIR